jgi:hypothetical protein
VAIDSTVDIHPFDANILSSWTAIAPPFSWTKQTDNWRAGRDRKMRWTGIPSDVNLRVFRE